MNIKELFQEANPSEVVHLVASKHNIRNFLKIFAIEKAFNTVLKTKTENDTADYCVLYVPCYNAYQKEADTDLFFTEKEELQSIYKHFDSPKRIMLISRVISEDLSLTEILNSEICPLSLTNFSKEELCADILWELIFYNQIITNREKSVKTLLNNIQETQPSVSKNLFPVSDDEIVKTINKNILVSYPYYKSMLKAIVK